MLRLLTMRLSKSECLVIFVVPETFAFSKEYRYTKPGRAVPDQKCIQGVAKKFFQSSVRKVRLGSYD